MQSVNENKIYGGNKVYSPDGELMFTCSDKKFHWYAQRNLMNVEVHPPSGRGILKFEPNGKGKADNPDLFVLKENRCVVCGSVENLTRHHVVPRRFRKHMPEDMKENMDYDIFALCIECHEKYEREIQVFDTFLFEKYGVKKWERDGAISNEEKKCYSDAKAILSFSENIPKDVLEYKLSFFEKVIGKKADTHNLRDFINEFQERRNDQNSGSSGEERLVKGLDDPDGFVILWRKHFVSKMKPKFLPKGWKINGPTRRK